MRLITLYFLKKQILSIGVRKALCHFVFLAAIVFIQNIAAAQNNPLQPIVDLFNDYRAAGIQEKIYVHTDKNYYLTGEILWFKIYYADAVAHKPLNLSKVAYLELLDAHNQPVQQIKAGLYQGEGSGSVFLSQNLASGHYKLRAYTQWMKNYEAGYFFEKTITIVNLNKLPHNPLPETRQDIDIQFFPEGGALVQGINSKIAFKAVDIYGKGLSFTGYVMDNKDTLLQFSPQHAGMGQFLLTPQAGRRYRAVVTSPSGGIVEKELPLAQAVGVTMMLTKPREGTVELTAYTNDPTLQSLYLLAHTRSSVKITQAATVQNGRAVFRFATSGLGEGISQITLFDDNKKPVCERLFFKKPRQVLGLQINSDQKAYNKRTTGQININVQGLTTVDTAGLSMTIYALDSLQKIDSSRIQQYLYLSSDLKGYIENPGYYFTNDPDADTAADNLMLTQGWRRFVWKDVLAASKPAFQYPPEIGGHLVTGQVINSLTGKPAPGIATYLSAPAGITEFGNSISNKNGFVKYEMNNFFGGTKIIAQTNPLSEDSIYSIEIYSPFSKAFSPTKLSPFEKPLENPETLLQQSIGMQVQNIYAGDKLHRFSYPSFTDTASFFVTPDYFYRLDDYTRFTSIEEVLREYVTLVNVRRRNGRVELPIVDVLNQQYLPGAPLNLLDGVPVFDFTKFFEFDPLKIYSLDVITQRYVSGQMMFGGILNWKTFKPSLENYHFHPNTLVTDYEGMALEREFYAPVYNTTEDITSKVPDYRNVLLWKPHIQMSAADQSPIKFYTSDLAGKYVVIVEGLSKNGIPGSAITTFEVR